MNPEISYLSVPDIVHVKASGELNFELGKELIKYILIVATEHECKRVLCDYTDVRLAAELIDLFDNPQHFNRWGVPRTFRIAVVYSADEENYKFWETVARNRGYMVRIFNNKDDALQWLTGT